MMQSIYTPRGKAREYCERAVNLYRGCGHRCEYCYAPRALRMRREAFDDMQPRPGILEALAKEAPKHTGREVLLCFTSDPYGPGTDDTTRRAIKILQDAGCRVTILTKGGIRSQRDFDLLRPGIDRYGVTLTFASAVDSRKWEPCAAPPAERLGALALAKFNGLETWASLEPVIDPEQSLRLIRLAYDADVIKIGKWNYDKRANEIDWTDFARRAVDLCESLGRKYVLKDDLKRYLEFTP